MSGLPVSKKWTMEGDVYIVCLLFRSVLFSVQMMLQYAYWSDPTLFYLLFFT